MSLSSLPRKKGLYLKHVPPKGRGVFCSEPITAGEIIEVSPVIIVADDDKNHIAKTRLVDYWFNCKKLFSHNIYGWADVANEAEATCFSLGITSICNHLVDSNATYEAAEEGNMPFFVLKAARDIPQDTEICINYGVAWFALHKTMPQSKK